MDPFFPRLAGVGRSNAFYGCKDMENEGGVNGVSGIGMKKERPEALSVLIERKSERRIREMDRAPEFRT